MQKHSGICLFLVAAEFKHSTGGNATLRVNACLGGTLSMSDKQRSFSDFLGKALIGPPHICKEPSGWSLSNHWRGTFSTVADKAVVDF